MLVGSAAALPGLPSRSMVADVGCGRGWLLGAAALDVTIVNIDSYVWPEWALSQHVLHVSASADALPFRDGTFDVVGSFDVLEHLPDDEAALGEQRRVVRPNGRVVVAVPADRRLWSPHDDAVGHFRRYDVPETPRTRRPKRTPRRTVHTILLVSVASGLARAKPSDASGGTGQRKGRGWGAGARDREWTCLVSNVSARRRWSLPFGTSVWAELVPDDMETSSDSNA